MISTLPIVASAAALTASAMGNAFVCRSPVSGAEVAPSRSCDTSRRAASRYSPPVAIENQALSPSFDAP